MYKGTTPPWKETYRKVNNVVFARFYSSPGPGRNSLYFNTGQLRLDFVSRHCASNETHPVAHLFHHSNENYRISGVLFLLALNNEYIYHSEHV